MTLIIAWFLCTAGAFGIGFFGNWKTVICCILYAIGTAVAGGK